MRIKRFQEFNNYLYKFKVLISVINFYLKSNFILKKVILYNYSKSFFHNQIKKFFNKKDIFLIKI